MKETHWNYRIFKYKDGAFGIHEAYYKNGKLESWTQEPIIVGDSVNELSKVLKMIQSDILRFKEEIIEFA